MEYDEMTEEDFERERVRNDILYDEFRDKKCLSKMDEDELYDRIFQLRDKGYSLEDRIDKIREELLHSHITLEEMDKIGEIVNE